MTSQTPEELKAHVLADLDELVESAAATQAAADNEIVLDALSKADVAVKALADDEVNDAQTEAALTAARISLTAANAEIKRLRDKYEPPTSPPPPATFSVPEAYSLYYGRDFTDTTKTADDAKWSPTNGTAGNHAGQMRSANVIKSGPNGQELICTKASATAPIYTGAVRNYDLQVKCQWYVRAVFRLQGMRRGFWPSLWMRPNPAAPGTAAPGEGEPDFIEVFGGHIALDSQGKPTGQPSSGYARIWGSTMILTPYGEQHNITASLDKAVPLSEWNDWHTFEWIKSPYKMECYVDGVLAATINAPASGTNRTKWTQQMEDPNKRYYVRLDAQAGTLPGKIEAGDFQAPYPIECRQQLKELVIGHLK